MSVAELSFYRSEQIPKDEVEELPANLRFLSAKGGSAFGGHYVSHLPLKAGVRDFGRNDTEVLCNTHESGNPLFANSLCKEIKKEITF